MVIRPTTDDWMGNDPVMLWIAAVRANRYIAAPVMHILGRYGIKKHEGHEFHKMAETCQTILLRQLGKTIHRNVHKPNPDDQLFIHEFSEPSLERIIEAKDWLYNAYCDVCEIYA